MAQLTAVNDDVFDAEVLQSSTPVLVDFSATWCGPCKALAPTLEALAEEYAGRVKFVQVDVDEAGQTAMKYGVTGVPTLALFKGGEVVARSVGNLPRAKIAAMLDEALGR